MRLELPPELPLLRPRWDAPARVMAAMSQREGGVSLAPWASFNLGVAVGDDPAAVAQNRQCFEEAIGAKPRWLRQVHGRNVLHLNDSAPPEEPADAAWTSTPGIACTVQVADCLPVLLCDEQGRAVAAAHAGWRGLAAGVLEATIAAMGQGAGVQPAQLHVWLGPCIGPQTFEVGEDVLRAFGADPSPADSVDTASFVYRPRADGAARWLANLQHLARQRLQAAGVQRISAEVACTVQEPSRFFSFRRDGVTGRMAAAIALR